MDERDRQRLTENLTSLTQDLIVREIFPYMIEEDILTTDDIEVISHEVTSGQQALKFITILMTKGPRAYDVFCSALYSTHAHLYQLLTGIEAIRGPPMSHTATVEKIQKELCAYYQQYLSNLSPIPWCEWFQLSLDKVYTQLRLVRGVQRKAFQNAVASAKCTYKVEVDSLFKAHQESPNPRRILVEGHAGIGKSTLCHKLAFDWTKDSNRSKDHDDMTIHDFDLLFLLEAVDFCDPESKTITDVVYSQLLPEDFPISKSTFKACLEQSHHKMLFIIDGYDEIEGRKCELLDKLMRGNLLSHSHVLVSSRPSYMLHLLKHFDTLYSAIGYDSDHKREFILKFAKEVNLPESRFEGLLQKVKMDRAVKEICRNPLNLSILCLLCAEESQTLPSTRTGLYKEVHEFLLDRAVSRMQIESGAMDGILSSLYKVSYEALGKGRCCLSEQDLKSSCCDPSTIDKVGFLTKEVSMSRFRPCVKYVFTHKSFQEFFAAKHLASLGNSERHQVLMKILGVRAYRSCCRFLFGLFHDREEALVDFTDIWFLHANYCPADDLEFELLTVFDVTECHQGHLLMQSLCELDDIPVSVARAFLSHFPPQMCFSFPLCTTSCVEGFLKVCNLISEHNSKLPDSQSQKSISVVIPAYCWDIKSDVFSVLFEKLTHSQCVSSVGVYNIADTRQLSGALQALRVGQPNSCIQRFKMRFIGMVQGMPDEFLAKPFGELTAEIEMYHCSNPDTLNKIIAGIPEQSFMKRLVVSQCSINREGCAVLSQKLGLCKNLEEFRLVDHSLNVTGPDELADLLATVASLRRLTKFHLSHFPSVAMYKEKVQGALQSLQCILVENKLTDLALLHCVYDADFCRVLKNGLDALTTMEKMNISSGLLTDAEAFHEVLVKLLCLQQLRHLGLEGMELGEAHVEQVGEILKSTTSLTHLYLSKLNCNLIDGITRGLQKNSSISCLSLGKLGFTGQYVTNFARTIQKLPTLDHLRLSMHPGNYLVDQEHISLFAALEKCESLRKVSLRHTGIEDHLVKHLCRVLANNPQISHLDIHHNMVSAEALRAIAVCLAERPSKLKYLDISDCLLTEASPVVEQLRNCCCFLRINWF